MYGSGIIKTLAMTLRHFLMTYVDDARGWLRRRRGEPLDGQRPEGIFTIQYPKERRELPERYRNLPFLVIDAETAQLRCTACGICAQICPVQCLWIERAKDPETGRPRRYPIAYHIDVSLCMSCGYCAEFCPFDAIKMDREFETASYHRPGLISARELAKPESYHAQIHPAAYAEEKRDRAQESELDSGTEPDAT
ncbi:MAG: 4Fe-4S binding protein [Anaerolineae bacterium]